MRSDQPERGASAEEICEQASSWLARRDRGLSRTEQDDYLEWLQADPRHAEAVRRCAATLERMMGLYEWQPSHTAEPNPDLFLPPPRRTRWWRLGGLAAAAALALAAGVWAVRREAPREPEIVENPYLKVNERVALPDGSRVELREGCAVVVRYSSTERRVQLTSGEAHFTVWNDAARPFVVEAAGMEVVAVGTSFSVKREPLDLEVLVTSGAVKLAAAERRDATPPPVLAAGDRAVVTLPEREGEAIAAPRIRAITSEEIAQSLAWLAPRLQFHETPLAEAVQQFNRLNRVQLVLGDRELGRLQIGGSFRPDNVDAFVRLLEATFRIRAERRGAHEIVLVRSGS